MFNYADKNRDGKISWEEFLVMITPVKLQEATKPKLKIKEVAHDKSEEKPNKKEDEPKKTAYEKGGLMTSMAMFHCWDTLNIFKIFQI